MGCCLHGRYPTESGIFYSIVCSYIWWHLPSCSPYIFSMSLRNHTTKRDYKHYCFEPLAWVRKRHKQKRREQCRVVFTYFCAKTRINSHHETQFWFLRTLQMRRDTRIALDLEIQALTSGTIAPSLAWTWGDILEPRRGSLITKYTSTVYNIDLVKRIKAVIS
jgi:hypothetical protein